MLLFQTLTRNPLLELANLKEMETCCLSSGKKDQEANAAEEYQF